MSLKEKEILREKVEDVQTNVKNKLEKANAKYKMEVDTPC